MQTYTKRWTVANTLTVMTVALAAIGFVRTEIGIDPAVDHALAFGKVAALIAIHACFTYRLTKALGRFLELHKQDPRSRKAKAALGLMLVYAGIDIWLVHSGLGWIFAGWMELALYLASAGFTAINLLGDWIEHDEEPEAKTAQARAANVLPFPPSSAAVSEETAKLLADIGAAVERHRQQA